MNIKMTVVLLPLLVLAGACRRGEADRTRSIETEAQVVALAVRTEPSGATVRVNNLTRTWKTPCDIADYALQRGLFDVELSLKGYETVRRTVSYNGELPAILELSLKPEGLAKAPEPKPEERAPVPPVQEKAPVPAKAKPEVREPGNEPAKPAPQAPRPPSELPPGARVRVVSTQLPVRVTAGKALVMDGSRPGEALLPDGERVQVEFLDPKTGAVLGAVEVLPREVRQPAPRLPEPEVPPAPVPVPAPVPTPPDTAPGSDRVGKVQLVHRVYGVFVKLEPGLQVEPGEEIVIMREGREIARAKILKMIQQDATYPDGAFQLQKTTSVKKGDEALRSTKP